MPFVPITVPATEHPMRETLISIALAGIVLFIVFKTGQVQRFVNIYNIFFWILFTVIWGGCLVMIFKWIWKKVRHIFKKKQDNQMITYSYDMSRFKDGNPDDINPHWLMG